MSVPVHDTPVLLYAVLNFHAGSYRARLASIANGMWPSTKAQCNRLRKGRSIVRTVGYQCFVGASVHVKGWQRSEAEELSFLSAPAGHR